VRLNRKQNPEAEPEVSDNVFKLRRRLEAEWERADPKADPYGFELMTISQLRRWLAGNNAEPGSQRYEHCRLILEDKIDQRDTKIKILQMATGTVIGIAGFALALAQFLA
jgi:hypothetical protein